MAQIGWIQFSSRADIKHLPLHEQKRKFLIENNSRLQEELHILNRVHGASGGSAGGSGGVAIDGPIAGAIVRSNVGTAVTDTNGNFKLPSIASGVITVTGGTDAITGLPYEGELIGDAQYKTISPITTFAHYLREASIENEKTPTLTIDEAITKTFTDSFDYFGISLPIEDKDTILQKDYIGDSILNNNKIGISAQAVATQIEAFAETIGVALEGSQQAAAATKAGKEIPEFSVENRKKTAYRALGRQAERNLSIEVASVLGDVKFTDPSNGQEKAGITFDNSNTLSQQLEATKNELASLAKQEQYTNNYLTTRIQAVNRAQKTTIKNEAKSAVEGGEFSNIVTVSTSKEVEDALKQIEKDKANETTPTTDGKGTVIPGGEFTRFAQLKQNKEGKLVLTLLELKDGAGDTAYFGEAKDAPLLLREFEGVYQPKSFTGGTATSNAAITPDTPLYIEVTTSSAPFDIVTTYTFRPTQSNRKGEPGIQVTLRLSQITEKKTEKVIDHIVTSEVGTYTAIYTALPKGEPVTFTTNVNTGDLSGNVLNINPPKGAEGLNGYQLGRYGKEPTTLLALTAPKLLGVNIQDLVFKDNELNINIPASSGQEEAVMNVAFTINE
mgnify:FL=1